MSTVSVVIPTYNRSALLTQAVSSVLAQTYRDFELIVVDDGSSDDTRARVAEIVARDPRVRAVHQQNGGLAAARNTGIRASTGSYVALLDDDDLWLPRKLERQVAAMEQSPDVDVVHCDFRYVDAVGAELPLRYARPESRGSLYEDLMYGNVIAGSGSAVLIRATSLGRVGLFDESLHAFEDQDLWRRMALAGQRFMLLDEVLLHIRWHDASMQKNRARMAEANVRYLEKLRAEAPARYRHHLREIGFATLSESAVIRLRSGRVGAALRAIGDIVRLGPGYALRFVSRLVLAPARIAARGIARRA